MIEKCDTDPNPECEHRWLALGWTTICEPPIAHSVCFKCQTFKHVQDPGGEVGRAYGHPDAVEKTWYTNQWAHGNWDWEREEARLTR